MTNFYVTYTLPEGKDRKAFFEEAKECGVIEKSRKEDGCLRYDFFYPADHEDQVFLWEQWESREAQKKHCQQPHYADFGKVKEKYGAETVIKAEDQITKK